MATAFHGMPGVYTGRSLTPRNIFVDGGSDSGLYVSSFKAIDGSLSSDIGNTPVSLLRAGLIMGKITTGGKYRPSIIGLTGVLHDTSAVTTTMTLPAAVVTEISRSIGASGSFKIIGPPTASGTVATETVAYSAIASSTTLTITATSADFAAGSIIAPADGAETPLTVLAVSTGIDVEDLEGNRFDQPMNPYLVGGNLKASQIINLTEADASVQAWIKTKLKAAGRFTFDNDR